MQNRDLTLQIKDCLMRVKNHVSNVQDSLQISFPGIQILKEQDFTVDENDNEKNVKKIMNAVDTLAEAYSLLKDRNDQPFQQSDLLDSQRGTSQFPELEQRPKSPTEINYQLEQQIAHLEQLKKQRELYEKQIVQEKTEGQVSCSKCEKSMKDIETLKDQLRQKKRQYENELKAHDALYEDFQQKAENEKELKKQIEELQARVINAEPPDQERIRELEIEIERLIKINEEIEEETRTRDSALDKAQVLIRKLNDECEVTAKKLSKSEKQIETLKKQLRQSERQLQVYVKQIENYDTLKRTEERLRIENTKIKDDIQEMHRIQMNESNEQVQKIESLLEERVQLNKTLEELGDKVNEIEKENLLKDEAFETEKQRNEELQRELENCQSALQKSIQDLQQREHEMDLEVQHIKRQAENVLRSFTTTASITNQKSRVQIPSQTPLKRKAQIKLTATPSTSKLTADQSMIDSDIKEDHNELLLQEALQRENMILKDLGNLSSEEGRFLQSKLDKLQMLPLQMRPELEK